MEQGEYPREAAQKLHLANCDQCKKRMPAHVFNSVGDEDGTIKLYCDACFDNIDPLLSLKKPKTAPKKRSALQKPSVMPKPMYHHISYPDGPDPAVWLGCGSGEHLFDEVVNGSDHYLHCDACGMEVHISKIVSH